MSYIQKISCEAEQISVPQEILDLVKDFKVAQSSYGQVKGVYYEPEDTWEFFVSISINTEGVNAKVGDYIISYPDGKKAIVSEDQFKAEFEAVPES